MRITSYLPALGSHQCESQRQQHAVVPCSWALQWCIAVVHLYITQQMSAVAATASAKGARCPFVMYWASTLQTQTAAIVKPFACALCMLLSVQWCMLAVHLVLDTRSLALWHTKD